MDPLKEFLIPFGGLAVGQHHFDLEAGDPFFAKMQPSEITHGAVRIAVDLDRQERMLIFDIYLKGTVGVECDRCLELFDLPIEGSEQLIVKFGNDYHEESSDLIVIPHAVRQIDLSQYIFEYINLNIPYKRVHPVDENGHGGCNPEQISRLGQYETKEASDPRWDKLKDIDLEDK